MVAWGFDFVWDCVGLRLYGFWLGWALGCLGCPCISLLLCIDGFGWPVVWLGWGLGLLFLWRLVIGLAVCLNDGAHVGYWTLLKNLRV